MRAFLERLNIVAFGQFANKGLGPFAPGMNVVYGKNEAGKTTVAKFIEGVLFGWEADRGSRNTYKPPNAQRAGTLVFKSAEGDEYEVSRIRNADGLQGSEEALGVLADIDKETFATMFALTSDELRSLRNTTDVTARLLTAGSGTAASPAHALNEVQERLSALTSRAASAEESLTNLRARREELRVSIAAASEEAERLKAQDKELHELEPQRASLQQRQRALNEELERLSAARATLSRLDESIAATDEQIASFRSSEENVSREEAAYREGVDQRLLRLDEASEARIRETMESLGTERARREHAVDVARENYRTSAAEYRAFVASEGMQDAEEKGRLQRRTQMIVSTVIPIVLLTSGVPTFVTGRMSGSVSISLIGIGLVICGVLMAAAALVMLFRPPRRSDEREERLQGLQWVMLQDEKKLEACESDLAEHNQTIAAYLAGEGLAAAQGSLRHARTMLDEANAARAQMRLYAQRRQGFASQRTSAESRLDDLYAARDKLVSELAFGRTISGFAPDAPVTLKTIKDAQEAKTQQRNSLQEALDAANHRIGELKTVLAAAQRRRRFDELKLEAEQVQTRLDESCDAYATLLLAQRMLYSAISAWESRSQPEVYARASRLLSSMTDGAWTTVRMSDEGRLSVVDSLKNERDPVHLSLGTCQQLYLSLRIALLMAAENVGSAVPILADDILVNFDDERRRGAARALAELSRVRQVILFTCHKDMADLMQEVDPKLNLMRL